MRQADFTQQQVSVEEYQRLAALHGPFADAVRELVDATIRTLADDDQIRDAQAAIEAVTATLRAHQLPGAYGIGMRVGGRGAPWGNPVIGLRNPIAPPLQITTEPNGLRWAEFHLGAAYEGPPGHVHGGVSALILDHLLGEAASGDLKKPAFTGTITLRYVRATPLGDLRAEAWIERVDGAKTYARGHILRDGEPTVAADGVFITPAWARDAR
ncbi:PaaI family thioesterase [Mycobacterium sp. MYCO198283]|uniref:PaaI family thioesterase n=1 Tax=Mycobacterium sp. MYCO198283 TaxID=2883505 RepID=UPI001E353F1A|nr:PaaI family thioesterase [Mycobacterium sp. MYCO198283]MCG5432668.1 PaaI family thioesterase [Mycobacterium sp. MYCO198283]